MRYISSMGKTVCLEIDENKKNKRERERESRREKERKKREAPISHS